MIHYHGCPITPRAELLTLAGRFFCHSFARPDDVQIGHEIGQGNMLDNGAFSTWRGRARGAAAREDWSAWWGWAEPWLEHPCTWAVIPDSIDGGVEENDRLLEEWGWRVGIVQGAPVWHLHEPIERLVRLCDEWPFRVCFGSSGIYRTIGTVAWHSRVSEAFDAVADDVGRVPPIHMLRGMSMSGRHYPFASADSTDIAQNHARPQNTAAKMAARWDSMQCPPRWVRVNQLRMEEAR